MTVDVRIYSGDTYVGTRTFDAPTSAGEVKEALREANITWVGEIVEDDSPFRVKTRSAELKAGMYRFNLQRQSGDQRVDETHILKEVRPLLDFVEAQKRKAGSVAISLIGIEEWGRISATAGLQFEPFLENLNELSGLQLEDVESFPWTTKQDPADDLAHIEKHIQGAYSDEAYVMYDARTDRDFLTLTDQETQIGFQKISGTTDAALVLRQAAGVGLPATGARWLWLFEQEPLLKTAAAEATATEQDRSKEASTSEAATASAVPLQSAQETKRRSESAFRAMTCLLLANIMAPSKQPGITLIGRDGQHILYWLNGRTIVYFVAPDCATAWAVTKIFLSSATQRGGSITQESLPDAFAAATKRQRLDLGRLPAGSLTSEQMADLGDCLGVEELRVSQAASLLAQLRDLPAFTAIKEPPPPGMYS